MSSDMLAQVLRFSNPTLTRPQKNLLLVLAYHTHRDTGLAYPGHTLLSQELMVSVRQVRNLVHQVEKAGWVEVRRGQGRGHLTVYRLKLDPEDVIHRKGEIPPPPPRQKRGNPAPEKGKSEAAPYKEVEREREKNVRNVQPPNVESNHRSPLPPRRLTLPEQDLLEELEVNLRDTHSRGGFIDCIHRLGTDSVRRLLLELFEQESHITGPLGAYFIGMCKRDAARQRIDLFQRSGREP